MQSVLENASIPRPASGSEKVGVARQGLALTARIVQERM